LKNLLLEYSPLDDLFINCTLKLLPVPGLPIIISGIFVIKETNNKKTFSFNNSFSPIPLSGFTCSIKKFCSTFRKSLNFSLIGSRGLSSISVFNSSN